MDLRLARGEFLKEERSRGTVMFTEPSLQGRRSTVYVISIQRGLFPADISDEDVVIGALSHEAIHDALIRNGMQEDEHSLFDFVTSLHWPTGRDGISWYRDV